MIETKDYRLVKQDGTLYLVKDMPTEPEEVQEQLDLEEEKRGGQGIALAFILALVFWLGWATCEDFHWLIRGLGW